MLKSFLDNIGLQRLVEKIKTGYVPISRTINGKPLSSNISLAIDDIGGGYSTSETRIGMWVDGKPIYRKIFSSADKTITSSYTHVVSSSEITPLLIANVITCKMCAVGTGGYGPKTYYGPDIFRTIIEDNYIKAALTMDFNGIGCKNIYVILEYTKTTD